MATIYKRVLHQAVRQKWPRKSDQSAAWTDGLSPSGAAGVVAMMMDTRCWLWSWCWWWCRWISGQSATQTDGLWTSSRLSIISNTLLQTQAPFAWDLLLFPTEFLVSICFFPSCSLQVVDQSLDHLLKRSTCFQPGLACFHSELHHRAQLPQFA